MVRHVISHLATAPGMSALLWILLPASPVQANQIVALVDDQGRKIYVNTGQTTPQQLASSSQHSPADSILRLIQQTADRFQVDPNLVHAIVQVESEYNPQARSPKGAMGLMQLIPATARRFGVENPLSPEQNIEGGVTYLRYLLDLFGGDLSLSLAAYNAGENSVLRQGGIPAFTETREYVQKVSSLYQPALGAMGSRTRSSKFGVKTEHPGCRTADPRLQVWRYVDANGVVHFEQ